MNKKAPWYWGSFIAAVIVFCWFSLLWYLLNLPVLFIDPLLYIFILLQCHLYTGLFITAHDAMHGVAAPGKPKLNKCIGTFTALLFAYNWYPRLYQKHHQHHRFVATEQDPDYHSGSFWNWYLSFIGNYVTVWQILLMGSSFMFLMIFFPIENIVLFWALPSILATFQLFIFGTYLPHRGEHEEHNKHKSSTLSRNHLFAFLSCYFFGYHYEHHEMPYVPWWQLYKTKSNQGVILPDSVAGNKKS